MDDESVEEEEECRCPCATRFARHKPPVGNALTFADVVHWIAEHLVHVERRLLAGVVAARLNAETVLSIASDLRALVASGSLQHAREEPAPQPSVLPPSSFLRRNPSLDDLPDELLLLLFTFVHDAYDLVQISAVCRRWRILVRDPHVWRTVRVALTRPIGSEWPIQYVHAGCEMWDAVTSLPLLRVLEWDHDDEGSLRDYPLPEHIEELIASEHVVRRSVISCLPSRLTTLWSVAGEDVGRVVAQCPHLRELRIGGADDDAIEAARLLTGLRKLSLFQHRSDNTHQMSPRMVDLLASQFPLLNELSLDSLTTCHLSSLRLPTLRQLTLSSATAVKDEDLCHLAQYHPLLETLEMWGCVSGVTGFRALSDGCPLLTSMALDGMITDDVIPALPPSLTDLSLGSVTVTFEGLRALPQRCPRIHAFDVRDPERLAEQAVLDEIRRAMPLYQKNTEQCFCPCANHLARTSSAPADATALADVSHWLFDHVRHASSLEKPGIIAQLRSETIEFIARDLRASISRSGADPVTALDLPLTTLVRQSPNVADLPDDVLVSILRFLDEPHLLARASTVCRRWLQLARHPAAWEGVLVMERSLVEGIEVGPEWPIQCFEGSLSPETLPFLGELSHLRHFELSRVEYVDDISALASMPLTGLRWHRPIASDKVAFLPTSLTALSLSRLVPASLAVRCPQLSNVSVERATDEDIAALTPLSCLTRLALFGPITGNGLVTLSAQLSLLTSLEVRARVRSGWIHLPLLRRLVFSSAIGTENDDVRALAARHPLLETLSLGHYCNARPDAWAALATHCPRLTSLTLENLTDGAAAAVVPTSLTYLEITGGERSRSPARPAWAVSAPARAPTAAQC